MTKAAQSRFEPKLKEMNAFQGDGCCLESDDRADALTVVHEIESFVDLLEGQDVGHKLIHLDLAAKIILNKCWHGVTALPAWQCVSISREHVATRTCLQRQILSKRGQ